MPELGTAACHSFWDSYDRKTLYRIIVALENVEYWCVDDTLEIDTILQELGTALDQGNTQNLSNDVCIRVLANLRASKALRVLQSLDGLESGLAGELLGFAENAEKNNDRNCGKQASVFLRRNLVFERMQLLARVFSPDRILLLCKVLEQSNEEE